MKGKEASGIVDDAGKEKSNVPLKTSNKFSLLEKGEIIELKQVKKEVVKKVLSKELNEVKKANPTSTRKREFNEGSFTKYDKTKS